MNTLTGRIIIGAVAGAVLGVHGMCIAYQTEPSVTLAPLLAAICLGACCGSAIAVTLGDRSVSVFWLYLVVVFSGITILPWCYNGKMYTYLPLGSIYVNYLDREVLLTVLLPHVLISACVAALGAAVHRKLARRSAEKVRLQAVCATRGTVEGTEGAAP